MTDKDVSFFNIMYHYDFVLKFCSANGTIKDFLVIMSFTSHLGKTVWYRAVGYDIFLYLPLDDTVVTTAQT